MKNFEYRVRWADVDMNGHLRHSAYADFCSHARVELLQNLGMGMQKMRELAVGPILFSENLVYKKEVGLNEIIHIETLLKGGRKDASRWRILHKIYKANEVLACEVEVYGAWLNLRERRLCTLPGEYAQKLLDMPKSNDFAWDEES
ncbi:thioesterase [bacterium]|nr:thioesterase [bacterium]